MSYEPLHHKYRPKSFAELVGQSAIATTLTNAINTSRIAPAYLFTGPRGTGKTSSARILAKSLNCLSGSAPTATPCGVCDVCQGITKGYTVDVIEIDAASNTGVENVRDIIEKAQFAPVQCRYKVYVIDECLTGDSLVLTSEGLVRIDNPEIKGHKVLSYNDSTGNWEYKKVVRWFDQGERQTLVIKTTNREIRCTGNHLIRTDQGWIRARDVREGTRILSPANAVVAPSFTSMVKTDASEDLCLDTSSKAILTGKKHTTSNKSWNKPNHFVPSALVDVEKSLISPQWTTSLETVKSVHLGGIERVYDIEVEDNHNFVANGLSLHNCHMLSVQAFNALLKTLEEPPKHIVFVLATTDPQRVLPTIISRCQRFDFRRIPLDAMVSHLTDIARKENINITTEAITLVAQLSQGGLRDAESLLDQLSLLPDQVTPNNVWDLVGTVSEHDLYWLFKAIAADNAEELIDTTRKILDRGREPLTILQNLAGFYRDLLIAKTASNRGDLVACTQETWQALVELVHNIDIHGILAGQQHLRSAEVQLKNTTQPRLWLEVTLLGLLPSAQQQIVSTSVSVQVAPTKTHQPPTNNLLTNGKQPAHPTNNQQPQTNNQQLQTNNQQLQTNNQQPQTNNQQLQTNNQQLQTNNQQPQTNNQQPQTNNQQPQTNNQPNDLTQTWQQVLSHLEPVSRRELLRQMCSVIDIRSEFARLGVRQAWHKRVQEDLPLITRAFKAAFNREITVNLEILSSASHRTKEETVTSRTEIPASTTPPLPPKPELEPLKATPANEGNGNLNRNGNYVQNTTSNLNKDLQNPQNNSVQNGFSRNGLSNQTNQSILPQQPQLNKEIQEKTEYESAPDTTPDTIEDASSEQIEPVSRISSVDVEKVWFAAERLAQFFDGQIVGNNEDAAEYSDSAASSDLIDVVEDDD